MFRLLVAGCVGLLLAAPLHAENLPSFDLAFATKTATDIVVVQEGKIVDVWKGTSKIGDRWTEPVDTKPREVDHQLWGADIKVVKQEITARKLQFVTRVTGKRQVLFRSRIAEPKRAPGEPDPAQTDQELYDRRKLATEPAYSTVWIEAQQAFAEQQWMNPGPASILPINESHWNRQKDTFESVSLTEGQLKQAVADWLELHRDFASATAERDPLRRNTEYLKLLRPEDHRRLDFVGNQFPNTSPHIWSSILPMLNDPESLPIHAELIYLAKNHVPFSQWEKVKPKIEEVLAENLPRDANEMARIHDHRRKRFAKWLLDYWAEVEAAEKKPR